MGAMEGCDGCYGEGCGCDSVICLMMVGLWRGVVSLSETVEGCGMPRWLPLTKIHIPSNNFNVEDVQHQSLSHPCIITCLPSTKLSS